MLALGNIARAHVAAREELLTHAGPGAASASPRTCSPSRRTASGTRWTARSSGSPTQDYNHAFLEAPGHRRAADHHARPRLHPADIDGRARLASTSSGSTTTRARTSASSRRPPFVEFHYRDLLHRGLTDIGWEDYPEGFGQMLLETQALRAAGVDHRERHRRPERARRRSEFLCTRTGTQVLEARGRGRRRARLPLLVAARQLRVARGLGPALRPLPRRLRDAGARAPRRPATTSAPSPWSASSGLRGRSPRPAPARPGRRHRLSLSRSPAPSGHPATRRRSRRRHPRPRARGRRLSGWTGPSSASSPGRPPRR